MTSFLQGIIGRNGCREKHLQGNRYEENEMEQLAIDGRKIGPGEKTYIVAEMSANHLQDFHRAVEIVHAAAEAVSLLGRMVLTSAALFFLTIAIVSGTTSMGAL